MSNNNFVTIVGAGVSGITTAIVLELLGHKTRIIAEDRADNPRNRDNPCFSSLYPSASVIPHTVSGEATNELFNLSSSVFDLLNRQNAFGVTVHKHYEVFEFPSEDPPYSPFLDNFNRVENSRSEDPDLPRLPHAEKLYGWSFNCYFADWPVYLPSLFRFYEKVGGRLELRRMDYDSFHNTAGLKINCAGLEAPFLVNTDGVREAVKGHLISVKSAPVITTENGLPVSYNYNPTPGKYSDVRGNRQDVYFYPRKDGWILGGSRLRGHLDKDGNWRGPSPEKPSVTIGGKTAPSSIIELNGKILSQSYGVDLSEFKDREIRTGYRFTGTRNGGLKLGFSKYDKSVIHNYAHGGAGVTLSWGCALAIAGLLDGDTERPLRPEDPIVGSFKNRLVNLL